MWKRVWSILCACCKILQGAKAPVCTLRVQGQWHAYHSTSNIMIAFKK